MSKIGVARGSQMSEMKFEDYEKVKLSESGLSRDDFIILITEKLKEQATEDELLLEAFDSDAEWGFEEQLVETIGVVYDSPTYFSRANAILAYNKILRDVRGVWREIKYNQSLEVVDEFTGMYVGGADWTNVKDRNKIPKKQDLVFITFEGGVAEFRNADIFGARPRGFDEGLVRGTWYTVKFINNESNGRTYKNVGSVEEFADSEGYPPLKDLLNEMAMSTYDVEPSHASNYQYIVVKGAIRNIAPVPILDYDYTQPPSIKKNADGTVVYDSNNNPVEQYPITTVGHEDVKSQKLSGIGEHICMFLRLQDAEREEEGDRDVFFEVRFYNQHFGEQTIDLDFDDFLTGSDDDPEELAMILSDYLAGTEVIGIVKMVRFQADKKSETPLDWLRASGIYLTKNE